MMFQDFFHFKFYSKKKVLFLFAVWLGNGDVFGRRFLWAVGEDGDKQEDG
jgi:hypothetical protein